MLALAGVPGIYVHSLFGSHNDQAGYERSGWKRDLNHERLFLADVEARLSDPSSEAARVFAGYRRLLEVRRAEPTFHPASPQAVLDFGPGIFALRRGPRDGAVTIALHNVTASPIDLDARRLVAALVTGYGGPTRDLLSNGPFARAQSLTLPPYGVAWLAVGAEQR
jgi:sucrose phosphorylase